MPPPLPSPPPLYRCWILAGSQTSGKSSSILDCLIGDVDIDLTEPTGFNTELQSYISEPVRLADPMAWWKVNEDRFPSVARLAKEYLSIPATEVASERMFSAAGLTVTKLRSQLDPGTVDAILFLHKNYVAQVYFHYIFYF